VSQNVTARIMQALKY